MIARKAVGTVRGMAGLAVLLLLAAPIAAQPTLASPPEPAPVTGFVRNWTRAEVWRFFEPPPGGGQPDYEHVGNRLQAGLRYRTPRVEAVGALQYVQFAGLPRHASGRARSARAPCTSITAAGRTAGRCTCAP